MNRLLKKYLVSDSNISSVCKSLFAFGILFLTIANTKADAEELINLNVSEEGVYEVTYAYLKASGLDLKGESIDHIAVLNKGQIVDITVNGSLAKANEFGPGASIRFVAKGLDTLYTDTNVYTLSLDSKSQSLIQEVNTPLAQGIPYATSYLEKSVYAPQSEYSFASPNKTDPWFAKRVLALKESANDSVTIDLDDVVAGGNTGREVPNMTMKVWGASDLPGTQDDHHVKVKLNGQALLDKTFDGFERQEWTTEIPQLKVGSNSINIELPLDQGFDYEAVNLNSIEVNYPRAFVAKDDVLIFDSSAQQFLVSGFSSDQISVYRQSDNGPVTLMTGAITGGRCTVSSLGSCSVKFSAQAGKARYFIINNDKFKQPEISYLPVSVDINSGRAEYLIITHPDFIASGNDQDLLAELKSDLESQYSSVEVIDVDQIYAQYSDYIFDPQAIKSFIKFAHENKSTKVVLLVGGDVYDYRAYENQSAQSFIPSIYVATDDMINFAPVDSKYVDINNTNVPDLEIGRLPVRTINELKTLLDKRTAYKNRSYSKTAIFAADVFNDTDQYSFKLDAQSINQEFFQQWNVDTSFIEDLGVEASRQKLIDRINQGVSLTSFFGHSSTAQWTFDGLFNGFDAQNLQNTDKPTIVTQWGCWNTYYVNPNEESMGHHLLMEGNRGAVSVLGATTLTSAQNEKALARYFYNRITNGETLGEALLNAKIDFAAARGLSLDVVLGVNLLGFPDLTL